MSDFAGIVEGLLIKLVNSQDSETIRSTTLALNTQIYVSAKCIPALVQVLSTSPHDHVRQLAAVELRKRITKWWLDVPEKSRTEIKTCLLQVVFTEQRELVSHAIARVISPIAQIDRAENKWPELLPLLNTEVLSTVVTRREVGIYCILALFETVPEIFDGPIVPMLDLFRKTVEDQESKKVRVTTVKILGRLADLIHDGDKETTKAYVKLIPSMVKVLEDCLKENDEQNAAEIFEVFDGLAMLDDALFSEHLVDFIQFLLSVGASQQLDSSLRLLALSSLTWIILYKQNKIRKLKLVKAIVEHLVPIGTEEDCDDIDEQTPPRAAYKALDTLASHVPPEHIVPVLSPLVMSYFKSTDSSQRKASMMGLAVIIESCSDYIRPKIQDIIHLICTGLQDSESIVRHSACSTLQCLANKLPSDVAEHHAVFMPLIFNLLNDTKPENAKHSCDTLDALLEDLDTNVLQYIPTLLDRLLWLVDNATHTDTKAATVGSIGNVAQAAGQAFQPYFEAVLPHVRQLMSSNNGEDEAYLRGVATDSIGAFAEAVGADMFRSHTEDIMRIAIEQLHMDSFRLRESSYALFSVLASLYAEEFAAFLPTIMPAILASCNTKEDDEPNTELETGSILDSDCEEEDYYPVNSALADEKEFAADALGELFKNTRTHFLPYVEESLHALMGMTSHLFDGVRKAAAGSLFTFIKTLHSLSGHTDWIPGLPVKYAVDDNVQKIISMIIPTILTMWSDEDERTIVIQICQELAQTMQLMGPCVVAECKNYQEDISKHILDIFKKQSVCQESLYIEDIFDDDDEEGSESLLICSAADLVAVLCKVIGEGYATHFETFLPLISKYSKNTRLPSERIMATRCLSQCVLGIKSAVSPQTLALLRFFLKALADEEEDVRTSALIGVGALVEYTQTDITAHFQAILMALHPLFQNKMSPNTTDIAIGVIARLILRSQESVPLEFVLPVFLNTLPLKVNFAENEPVFTCLFALFRANNAFVMNHIPQLLPVFIKVLSDDIQLSSRVRAELIELLRALNAKIPELNIRSTDLGCLL